MPWPHKDITGVNFPARDKRRKGLGPGGDGKTPGFFAHAMIALDAGDEAATRPVSAQVWTRAAEVIAATSGTHDIAVKYANYFRHPGVQHFLLLFIETRIVLLHSRSGDETLRSRIAREGDRLTLDPPGIEAAVSDFFAGLDSAFAD